MKTDIDSAIANANMEIEYANDLFHSLRTEHETRKLWRAWSGFLAHYVSAVSAMRFASNQGSTKLWSDKLLSEQKLNANLNYMLQSHNAGKHRSQAPRVVEPKSASIGNFIKISGNIENLTLSNNTVKDQYGVTRKLPEGKARIIDGRFVEGTIDLGAIDKSEHFVRLQPVENRGVVYDVPSMDVTDDLKAIHLAEEVVTWLDAKFSELKELLGIQN